MVDSRCGCGCNTSGSISGCINTESKLRGRIYAPTYVSAYSIAVQHGFVGTEEEWLESLKGDDGKSAYEIAVELGFEGTEEEWLESLHGEDGKSAYEIAVEEGFEGTEEEWLQSLVGRDGKSAYEIAVDHGYEGTEEEWIHSIQGTYDHNLLYNRDLPDSHPISAITDLESSLEGINSDLGGIDLELDQKQNVSDSLTPEQIAAICH